MTKHLRNLGAYNKAIAAGLGSAITVVLALLGFGSVIPENVAGWLVGAVAVATTVVTFLVKNQDGIDRAGDTLADLLDRR
jgi:hypothetical protein